MAWARLASLAQRAGQRAFGVEGLVSWEPKATAPGPGLLVAGVFFEAWRELSLQTEAGVDDRRPHLDLMLEDLPAAPVEGDRVRIPGTGGKLYEIVGDRPDGEGVVTLPLHEVTVDAGVGVGPPPAAALSATAFGLAVVA